MMKKIQYIFLITMFTMQAANAQNHTVGIFSTAHDVGDPKIRGGSLYNAEDQTYHISGGGYNIWFNRDEFHFLSVPVDGDFMITANFAFIGQGRDAHRKIGLMARETLDDDASHVSAVIHGDGLTSLQWRALKGAFMRDPEDEIKAKKRHFSILQLERSGSLLIMRAAHFGEPLQEIGRKQMDHFEKELLVGLFISAHNADVMERARVWNVRLDRPVNDDHNPYDEGFLGCRLETMNVFNGKRRIVYEADDRFEAPNWMPDGNKLLFNAHGSLFTIPAGGGHPEKMNTGSADRNNNDHGISFNGKLLAISSSHDNIDGGGSAIYVVPLEGGEPRLVTKKTPSYWHGWNPNNKELVYVAKRHPDDPYNIFSANIKTGEEEQLTHFDNGHVDGPEYSPDGRYIYYNGSQSGTMQIWRMRPNGSGKEQLTFGALNNWFPHISPDGQWMVYLAFPTTVSPDDHPSYKRVTLFLSTADGKSPRAIAYLYGGQGSINVPSWSPDSQHIAFVSNSALKTEASAP
jgi:TolB protein